MKPNDLFTYKDPKSSATFRIESIDEDGYITAVNVKDEPANKRGGHMPTMCLTPTSLKGSEDAGFIEWVIRDGKTVDAIKAAAPEIREMLGKARGAVEFLPEGAPIPYDIAQAGLQFD